MKKIATLFLISAFVFTVNAQDNTIPTAGNVGIGTLNPSSRLDVNGTVKIDSCLIVMDTVIFEKKARMEGDVRIEANLYL
ncbi:MAG: hypothetical protein P8N52_03300 [Crocinitomicaceae bacterium]|nr:hypothetical protein [Crocinitomicaceae bacterium]MDG1777387.1 hypothetical protein [Crocinitomicaceae bacterium]